MEVFKVFATLGFNGDEFSSGLSAAEARLNGIERNFTGAGRALTAGLTVPIIGVGAAALTSSITFESAFAGVRKTVDATEEEFADLERGIRDMSQRMPASAESIASVAEAAGQLGIHNEQILGFTEVMIGLGEATNMTAETAATSLARFANIVQMPQESFDRLGSSIVQLGNNLATTEGEITEMGLRIAGAGKQIGLTEPEIMGVAGALSSVGISAEAGGTSISRVMLTMMTDVMNGGEGLQNFADVAGMTSEEFATAFRERPAEAITSFVSGLGRISSEGGNVVNALDELGLGEIRVRDALLRMSGAGDVLTDSIRLSTDAWNENTALQEEVEQRYNTTESQLTMLWNAVKEVTRTLGDALVPILMQVIEASKPFIAWLQSAVEWFGNLDPGMQTFIVAAAGIVAAIGPVLMIIGSFAGAISNLLPLLGLIPGAMTAVGAAFTLLTGPVGIIIAAIGALVAVFATDFLGIRTAVVNAWNAIVDAFSGAWDSIGRSLRGIRDSFTSWWDGIRAFFSDIPGRMLGFGTDIVTGLADGIRNSITNAVEAVTGLGSRLLDNFKGMLGIESPSKVFHEFGLNIGDGLAQGMNASEGHVSAAAARLAEIAARAYETSFSGAWTSANIVGGVIGDLEGKDAIAAINERLDVLKEAQRWSFARSGVGSHQAVQNMYDSQISMLEAALEQVTRELRGLSDSQQRNSDAQAARFGRSVDQFDNSVRGYTLASQRY